MIPQNYRIGNYAEDQHGNLLKVFQLTEHDVHFWVVDRSKFPLPDGWKARPIKITEEWLLKLGFVENYRSEFRLKYEMSDPAYGYNFSFMEGQPSGFVYRGEILKNIQCIHQLQNLYHSLTDTELTLTS